MAGLLEWLQAVPAWLWPTVTAVSVLVSWITILAILRSRREPLSMLSWVLALLFLPVLGLALYFLLGEPRKRRALRRHERRTQRIARAMADAHQPAESAHAAFLEGLSSSVRDLARHADRFASRPLRLESRVEAFIEPDALHVDMLAAIEGAARHVHLEYYIFRHDATGALFRDALTEAARRGVQVRLLLDFVGSLGTTRRFFRSLIEAGGQVEWFHPAVPVRRRWNVNYRNHRKIVVVDGSIAYVGSQNIGDEYRGLWRRVVPWKDTHLRVEGPAVTDLQEVFVEDWCYTTEDELTDESYFPALGPAGDSGVQILASGLDSPHDFLQGQLFLAMSRAARRVRISTPYFVPDSRLLLALTSTARRGVDVELLVPSKTDSRLVLWAGRSYYQELIDAGVRIFEHPDAMLHSKLVLVDGEWALVGSANMDIRSFELNFEISAAIYDRAIVTRLETAFAGDASDARPIHRWPPDRRIFRPYLEGFARVLSPLL